MSKELYRARPYSSRRLKIVVGLLTLASALSFYGAASLILHYYRFSRMIELRLRGERWERPTWIYARPFVLYRGQELSPPDLTDLLNGLRYLQKSQDPAGPGTFSARGQEIRIHLRGAATPAGRSSAGRVRVLFQRGRVTKISKLPGDESVARIDFEPEPVTTLFGEDRAKQRSVTLKDVPRTLVQAVVATEDRRFFDHTGIDLFGILRAAFEDLRAQEARQGGSTITQQLVKNYFLTPEKTLRRKIVEAFLALILESRARKEEILELYLNEVYLGQRGSFSINGVGQAARVFFGKDVRNLPLEEAALLAGLIRSPNADSPFRFPERALARRNAVLALMARNRFIKEKEAQAASARPLRLELGGIDSGEAPYFVDLLRRELLSRYPSEKLQRGNLAVYSTLDRYLQNAAQSAVADGLTEIEGRLRRRNKRGTLQASLIALDPENGDVLALTGGRSYGTSQFNRAVDAHRQPGSAFKPFVYLAAFEYTYRLATARSAPARYPLVYFTPATLVNDEPTTFAFEDKTWAPANYGQRFEGMVTLRRALALSLNVATAKVGEMVGYDRVVALWKTMGMRTGLRPYPSMVLGSFEMTPMELATAYAVIASGGMRVEPRLFTEVKDHKGRILEERQPNLRRVVHPESAYLVTDMMKSVIDQGTGAAVRARGFSAEAAGKTGTTNDTRDAWFAGFTPGLLAVVWVGYDENERLGLSGAQAALPIWTRFMKAAASGRGSRPFQPPPAIVFATIDAHSGLLPTYRCPDLRQEAFLDGTEPVERCPLH